VLAPQLANAAIPASRVRLSAESGNSHHGHSHSHGHSGQKSDKAASGKKASKASSKPTSAHKKHH